MNIAFTHKDKKKLKRSLIILVIGLLMLIVIYSPILSRPQCASYLNNQGVQNPTGCISGADIGLGMLLLVDMAILLYGLIALIASILQSRAEKADKFTLVLLVVAVAVIFALIHSWYRFGNGF